MFDVELEDADDSHKSKRKRPDGAPSDSRQNKPNAKRQAKNARYGFGGKKRHSKSGDAMSSSDMTGFSIARMKGKTRGVKGAKQRPGKSRRAKGRL
jgi:rRNA-processing protein EBP2